METDPERMVQLLVGLPEVNVLGVDDGRDTIEIHVSCRRSRPGCPDCGVLAHLKDRRVVVLVDLPCFGKPTKLAWHKARWRCPEAECPTGSWAEGDGRMALDCEHGSNQAARTGRKR